LKQPCYKSFLAWSPARLTMLSCINPLPASRWWSFWAGASAKPRPA